MFKAKILIKSAESEADEQRYKIQYTKANDILNLSKAPVIVYGNVFTSTILQTVVDLNDLKTIVDVWTDSDLTAKLEISKDIED